MKPEILQSVLLSAASHRCRDDTLDTLVTGLSDQQSVALARIWLIGTGDQCETCPLRAECPDTTRCLHLVASAGTSRSGDAWSRIDGDFRRMPIGVRKVGGIAALERGLLISDVRDATEWIVRPQWVLAEGIRSFAGQPLCFGGETLGVLALFSREQISDEDFRWIRVFADHAAAAIANANAYDEVSRLHAKLEQENAYLRAEVEEALDFGEIVGSSPALRKVMQQVDLVAPTDASVLVQGESGTGKELIARSIHERSRRCDRPMIKVNCATVPKDLFESEFFGHVKGSFTGAVHDRAGRFELANQGTLFLDEVGEIPIELQSKLLRVLQEGEFERVGDSTARKVDVRVISATNRNLIGEIEAGRFRQDLFYRLSVFPIELPSLRERPEDIGVLASHFVACAAKRHGRTGTRLTRRQVAALSAHDWPGNVRELQHVIERAIILSTGGRLDLAAVLPVPTTVPTAKSPPSSMAPAAVPAPAVVTPGVSTAVAPSDRAQQMASPPVVPAAAAGSETGEGAVIAFSRLKELERQSILAALKRANGRIYGKGGAAELLGTKPTTLSSRIKALRIPRSSEASSNIE